MMRALDVRLVHVLAVASALLPACSDDGNAANDTGLVGTGATDGTTAPDPDASGDANPSTTAPGDTTSASGPSDDSSGESTGGPPAEPAVHWVGRYDTSDPALHRMGWSGSGFVVRFDGTGASVTMDDAAGFFTVVVDGMVQPTLLTSGGSQAYPLATGLAPGEHTVELYRRTEGSFGPTAIASVDLEGELLPPPPVDRRMEVIGDSITAGYGNEGVSPCSFSGATENHYLTYGAIAARMVQAEVHTVAWSGKGMVTNYGDDTFEPLPEIYDRTLASEGAAWDFSWQPDVVVLNIGTNDFSTDGDPAEGVFVPAYVDFLAHLRDVYPGAFILAVSPTLFGAELTMVEGYLQDAVGQRNAAGDPDVAWANINVRWIGSGCDGHPTVATHEGMAGELVAQLQTHLGW